MKKFLTLVAAFSLIASTASAQMFGKDKMGKTTFGIRAGVSISSIRGQTSNEPDDKLDLQSRLGFNAGVIMDIPITNGFYIQPGLLFTTKGAKDKRSDEFGTSEVKYNASYLEVPVLASFRFNASKSVQIQANVGPYFALGIGGKCKSSFTSLENSAYNETDEMPIFGKSTDETPTFGMKRFDLGLAFGVGVTISKHYYIGVQYDLGLMNLAIKDQQNWGDQTKINSGNLMIQVGYNF